MENLDFPVFDEIEVSTLNRINNLNFVPIVFANEPLGYCQTRICAVEGKEPRDCRSWSDPYGCGSCCVCRGCLKPEWERHTAPQVWEGDYA